MPYLRRTTFMTIGCIVLSACQSVPPEGGTYNPMINPEEFSATITNPYFTATPGKTMIYEGRTADGLERIEVEVTSDTKEVMGVTTLVLRDRVWLDDVLIEDTRDYLAQDQEGNVWYFGEDVDNYENGVLQDHHGAWLAGVDTAKPGIWMKAQPKVGEVYRQEYYAGEAEDMAEVLAVDEKVTTPAGTFTQCLKTRDWNPLESIPAEHKYYCRKAGGMVLEVDTETQQKVELIEYR